MPRAERIRQQAPTFNTEGHFRVSEQASVQFSGELAKIDILANEDQLLAAIACGSKPVLHDRGCTFFILRPLVFRHEPPPAPGEAMPHQATGLGPTARL